MSSASEDRRFGVFDKVEQRSFKVQGTKVLAELLGVSEDKIPTDRLIKYSPDDRFQIYESVNNQSC